MPVHARQGGAILPFLGIGSMGLGRLLCRASGCSALPLREKSDWVVSHGALPSRAWWVTSAAYLYNKSYKEPRHE